MKNIILVVILFVSSISIAHAGCWYAGSEYKVGTIINGYACKADGSWG
ncbi:MAG: hypothetical protein OEY06_09010 [Gammaproteobacteria bacterium]|nr:hypothetical protein [Gammaproteobacteria bacterium]